MASTFSSHLIDSFLSAQQPRGPFGQFGASTSSSDSSLRVSGPLSFAPQVHGTFTAQQSSVMSDSMLIDLSEETARKIATLQAKLDKKLGPEFISQRPGPGGGPKLTYVEGWKVISLANEVFGFNGWSSSVTNLTTDYVDCNEQSGRFSVGVTAIVRVTLRDGVWHEDVGYGMLENSKSKGAALDKCKKEAVTDAVKRTLRNFGNVLGNCLYDKSYTQEIVKIKVPPPKFDRDQLYRRPEFEESRTNAPSPSSMNPNIVRRESTVPQQQQQRHMPPPPNPPAQAAAMTAPAQTRAAAIAAALQEKAGSTPVRPNDPANPNAGNQGTGLVTPIQTPQHPAPQQQRVSSNVPRTTNQNPEPRVPQPPQQPVAGASTATGPSARRVSFAQPTSPEAKAARRNIISEALRAAEQEHQHENVSLPEPEDEEMYGLNSDDEAFFASVDMPGIDDTGIGGHIDFDEGVGGLYIEEEADESVLAQRPPAPAAQRQPSVVRPQPLPQQPLSRQPTFAGGRGPVTDSASHTPQLPEPNAPRSAPTSSAGRFNFPPGMNVRPGGITLKRNADTMLAGTSGTRRPLQGMGLTHQPGGSATGGPSRQPLATLEGGEMKRLRR